MGCPIHFLARVGHLMYFLLRMGCPIYFSILNGMSHIFSNNRKLLSSPHHFFSGVVCPFPIRIVLIPIRTS
ncbi:hypothetical protein K438DRAFT_1832542, partial [Mycena galopus ATCC 62051]